MFLFVVAVATFVTAVHGQGIETIKTPTRRRTNASPTHKNDREQRFLSVSKDTAITVVSQNGSMLQKLPNEWKNNKDVVIAAVRNNGSALQFASDAMKADNDVVAAAVTNNPSAIQYALSLSKDTALAVVTQNGSMLQQLPNEWKNDKDVVTAAVTRSEEHTSEL